MEVHGKPQASLSCSSSARVCLGVLVSKELLTAGSIWDRLLINSPKPNSRKTSIFQTANEKLSKETAAAPPGHFNIENIDGTLGRVIEMDVALFEMNQWDSKEEDGLEESSQDSSENSSESEDEEDSISYEVTIDNIELPNSEGRKGKIEVLDSPASKKKK
uniref:Uncharacterized protein n=1 Tax=Propithecus coquereli TaxID=379532 RepID=A0A2K6F3X9_PROCO